MSQNKTASSLHLPWALIYSSMLLAVIFCAVRRVLIELSLLMTTNVPRVASVSVIAALILSASLRFWPFPVYWRNRRSTWMPRLAL